jgi:hypothetical protein
MQLTFGFDRCLIDRKNVRETLKGKGRAKQTMRPNRSAIEKGVIPMSASRIALPVAAIAVAVLLLGYGATPAQAQYYYYPASYASYYAYPTYAPAYYPICYPSYYYAPAPVAYYSAPVVVSRPYYPAYYPSYGSGFGFSGGFYRGGHGHHGHHGRNWGFNFGFGYAH